jgi:hypothetical protein
MAENKKHFMYVQNMKSSAPNEVVIKVEEEEFVVKQNVSFR